MWNPLNWTRRSSHSHQPVVSVINQFYPPDYAATGQLLEELVTYLGEQGFCLRVFTSQPSYAFNNESAPRREHHPHVSIWRSRAAQFWQQRIRGKAINGLIFLIRTALHFLNPRHHSDLLLVTTAPPYLPILAYGLHLIFRLPYVCIIYDLYPDIAIQLGVISHRHYLSRIWSALNQNVWRNADSIIVLNASMKNRLLKKCPDLGDKIVVIHSWSDPNWIQAIPKPKNWFAQQHNLAGKFTVLYSGNMGRCHDLDTILDAAQQLRDQPIQFVFIGGGAKYQACLETVQMWHLNNCLFLPYQPKPVLPYSLTACDLNLVSMSEGMEGLVVPSKFYGCLAAARPIAAICEPQSDLRQLIARANCGETFSQGDSQGLARFIQYLATHPQQSKALGTSGRHYLQQHFTLDIAGQHYAQVLRQSLHDSGDAQPVSRDSKMRQESRSPQFKLQKSEFKIDEKG